MNAAFVVSCRCALSFVFCSKRLACLGAARRYLDTTRRASAGPQQCRRADGHVRALRHYIPCTWTNTWTSTYTHIYVCMYVCIYTRSPSLQAYHRPAAAGVQTKGTKDKPRQDAGRRLGCARGRRHLPPSLAASLYKPASQSCAPSTQHSSTPESLPCLCLSIRQTQLLGLLCSAPVPMVS